MGLGATVVHPTRRTPHPRPASIAPRPPQLSGSIPHIHGNTHTYTQTAHTQATHTLTHTQATHHLRLHEALVILARRRLALALAQLQPRVEVVELNGAVPRKAEQVGGGCGWGAGGGGQGGDVVGRTCEQIATCACMCCCGGGASCEGICSSVHAGSQAPSAHTSRPGGGGAGTPAPNDTPGPAAGRGCRPRRSARRRCRRGGGGVGEIAAVSGGHQVEAEGFVEREGASTLPCSTAARRQAGARHGGSAAPRPTHPASGSFLGTSSATNWGPVAGLNDLSCMACGTAQHSTAVQRSSAGSGAVGWCRGHAAAQPEHNHSAARCSDDRARMVGVCRRRRPSFSPARRAVHPLPPLALFSSAPPSPPAALAPAALPASAPQRQRRPADRCQRWPTRRSGPPSASRGRLRQQGAAAEVGRQRWPRVYAGEEEEVGQCRWRPQR